MKKVLRYFVKITKAYSEIVISCETKELAYQLFELLSSSVKALSSLPITFEEKEQGYPNFYWETPIQVELVKEEIDLYENEQEAKKVKESYVKACKMKLIKRQKQKHA